MTDKLTVVQGQMQPNNLAADVKPQSADTPKYKVSSTTSIYQIHAEYAEQTLSPAAYVQTRKRPEMNACSSLPPPNRKKPAEIW